MAWVVFPVMMLNGLRLELNDVEWVVNGFGLVFRVVKVPSNGKGPPPLPLDAMTPGNVLFEGVIACLLNGLLIEVDVNGLEGAATLRLQGSASMLGPLCIVLITFLLASWARNAWSVTMTIYEKGKE